MNSRFFKLILKIGYYICYPVTNVMF